MRRAIQFELNGQQVRLDTDDERILLWALRTDFALTGTKYGCGEGFCGACTVIVESKTVRSCLTPLKAIEGKKVITIEGLARHGKLHPLQQAFIEHGSFQCGYCTAGMLLTAVVFLTETPKPSHEGIVARMEGNLCRCGAHIRIIAAIASAASTVESPG